VVQQEAKLTDNASFVLRLWLEPSNEQVPDWRWKVHHVQSGTERYFRDLANVLEFVSEFANVGPPQISAPDGSE